MDYQFKSSPCPSLKRVLGEVRTLEQAQELRLTDGMPDIGKVLCGWGQVLQRSKEWNGDCISLSAGMMVWVLYAPEDGSEVRCVEGYIPFSLSWDLQQAVPEGRMEIRCLLRFVDARSVSARKIMVRAGISALGEAFIPWEAQVWGPPEDTPGVELKKSRYPLQVPVEAGEKIFEMEESLELPATVPEMEKPIFCTLDPEITEQRVMTDKVVFRGSANAHLLYRGSDGRLYSWDFKLPFNQFAELQQECSPQAEASLCCAVTSLELEQTEGSLNLHAGLTGQYVIGDQKLLELTEDAYSPRQELELQQQELEITRTLEVRKETLNPEMSIPGDGELAVDVTFLPDFPRQRRLEDKVLEDLSGTFQILYYDASGELQAAISRWEGQRQLEGDRDCLLLSQPLTPAEPQILMGGGDMKVRTELPLQTRVEAAAGIPMVSGLTLGEEKTPDPERPSLIIRRAVEADLWSLAKASGSTVTAIRSANGLKEDPAPGQMLLIPIL